MNYLIASKNKQNMERPGSFIIHLTNHFTGVGKKDRRDTTTLLCLCAAAATSGEERRSTTGRGVQKHEARVNFSVKIDDAYRTSYFTAVHIML